MSDEETRATLIRKRGGIKGQFTLFQKYVTDWHAQLGTRNLSLRIKKAEEIWSAFQEVQLALESLGVDEAVHKLERANFETLYFRVMSDAYDLIETQTPPPSPVTHDGVAAEVGVEAPHGIEVKLPRIELPTFSGEITDWISFIDIFTAIVDTNTSLLPVQKLWYLRSAVRGGAAQLIKGLSLSNDNYEVALNLLRERYDNKPLIVRHNLKLLMQQPSMVIENPRALRSLIDNSIRHVESLRVLGLPVDSWDILLIFILSEKLDTVTRRAWELHKYTGELPTFKEFTEFLNVRCQMLDSMPVTKNVQAKKEQVKYKSKDNSKQVSYLTLTSSCTYCKADHSLKACPEFKRLSVVEKRQHVKKTKACFNCLSPTHFVKFCKAPPCSICKRTHNSLLHVNSDRDKSQESQQCNEIIVQYTATDEEQVLLSTAVVLVADKDGDWHKVRCLIDNAAQTNLITQSTCDMLRLSKQQVNVPVLGVNNITTSALHSVEADITSHCNDRYGRKIKCLVVPNISSCIPSVKLKTSHFRIPREVILADDSYASPGPVDLLLSATIFWEILGDTKFRLSKNGPVLQETKLGYLVIGSLPVLSSRDASVLLCHFTRTDGLDNLEEELGKFWQLENMEASSCVNVENDTCEKIFSDTVQRDEYGRFQVALPFKQDHLTLGSSRFQAMRRFFALENKLAKDNELRKLYVEFMTEYEDLGHMERVADPQECGSTTYYIPYHAVHNETSTTTSLRVVFDCSAKSSNGVSLNDILLKGPVVQPDLFSILLRFREYDYCIQGDVSKMYRQVMVDPQYRNFQRIIWRPDRSHPIETYQLNTVTYGMICSSFLATKSLVQLVQEEGKDFQRASEALLNNTYVDDVLVGGESIEEVLLLRREITELLDKGCFHIRKWKSNSKEILDSIPKEDQEIGVDYMFTDNECTKTLGLIWQPKEDYLTYHVKVLDTPVTKRIMVSEMAKIYDPLGLIAPLIVRAKILVQQAWIQKLQWDETVPATLALKWNQLRDDFRLISQLQIPRKVVVSHALIQLHVYSDASKYAYGSCIYARCIDDLGNISVNLVAAKSKIAPIKQCTLPRLELCGAVMSVQLLNKVKQELNCTITKVVFWTDSMIVLGQIHKGARNSQVFVSNRISKILEGSKVNQWLHVSSKDNPADKISRGITVLQIKECTQWWNGPSYLSQEEINWPATEITLEEEEVQPKEKIVQHNAVPERTILERYSSMKKLLHVFAYVLRFIMNLRVCKELRTTGRLTLEELDKAYSKIVELVQKNYLRRWNMPIIEE